MQHSSPRRSAKLVVTKRQSNVALWSSLYAASWLSLFFLGYFLKSEQLIAISSSSSMFDMPRDAESRHSLRHDMSSSLDRRNIQTQPRRDQDRRGRKVGHTLPLAAPYDAPSKALAESKKLNDESVTLAPNSTYAYAFVIGGCNPDRPAYRNYVYDVLIASHLLRQYGSTADIVVFFQMSYNSIHNELPAEDIRWLKQMGVRIMYIPKSSQESFYQLQLNKFRILNLTEYRRVLFMDADVMPISNLDYLFELSERGVLQPTMIVAGEKEPANGGFFMLQPSPDGLETISRIIQAKVDHLKRLRTKDDVVMFDPVWGWGHTILPPDRWESNSRSSYNWTFNAPHSDQGLLYYFSKYVRQNTSIVLVDRLQRWQTNMATGEPEMVAEIHVEDPHHPFYSRPRPKYDFPFFVCNKCAKAKNLSACPAPYTEFVHFTGQNKPWITGPSRKLQKRVSRTVPNKLWWSTLTLLNTRLSMGIDNQLRNWTGALDGLLGHVPNIDHARHTTVDFQAKVALGFFANKSSFINNQARAPYAYAFVVGGCDPKKPAYRNYLYNVLNSAYLLKKHGSKADIVAFFQMSFTSEHERLPQREVQWLAQMGVRVKYIPKTRQESFYLLQLNKFRVLGLIEYRRVLFLDADVLPVANLDYLFELSDETLGKPKLQKNLILAGVIEPANGGFFMVQPTPEALSDVSKIIQKKVDRLSLGKTWKDKRFDPLIGWGHTILSPDRWESNKRQGTNWTFHAPYSDQGLLYYYAKYFRQNTTIVLADRVQWWQTNITSNEPEKVNEIKVKDPRHPFYNRSKPVYGFSARDQKCNKWTSGKGCVPPYSDFMHFSGSYKPWRTGPPDDLHHDTNSTPHRLWWSTLTLLNDEMDMGIGDQLKNWTGNMDTLLGHLPNIDHARHMTIDFGQDVIDEGYHEQEEENQKSSNYAYAFVIGGCDPDKPFYVNYVYDVLNAAYLLREFGSEADVVVFFQLSYKSSYDTIPVEQARWLSSLGVRVFYIPKSPKETFYLLQLNKFRVLGLTDYRRVLFMDADVLPLGNLDYLFHKSDNKLGEPSIRPNMILAGSLEPANGGFFMIEPNLRALGEITETVKNRVDRARQINATDAQSWKVKQFDPLIGWGHTILSPDRWESNKKYGRNWTFHAPYSDQGLLYYYAKYVRQNTTIVFANRLQHWGSNSSSGEPSILEEIRTSDSRHPFAGVQNPVYQYPIHVLQCNKWTSGKGCPSPYRDFIHFTGTGKPWNDGPPPNLKDDTNSTPHRLWWSTLMKLNEKLHMGIESHLSNWTGGLGTLLGHLPNLDHSRHQSIDFVKDAVILGDYQEIPSSLKGSESSPGTAISQEDATCPFRHSPLYRKIYVYPNYGDLEKGWSGQMLSKAGQNLSSLPEWPWLQYVRQAQQTSSNYFDAKGMYAQYSTEMIVQQIFTHTDSCLRTHNPEEASLFYVPYLPTMERFKGLSRGDRHDRSRYGDAILDILDSRNYTAWESMFGLTSKYWKRRGGSDHILVFGECLHGLWHPHSRRGSYHYIHTQKQLEPPIIISVELSTQFISLHPDCAAKNVLMPYPISDGDWINGRHDSDAISMLEDYFNSSIANSPAALSAEKEIASRQEGGIDSNNLVGSPRPLAQFYRVGFHGSCERLRRSLASDFAQCSPSGTLVDKYGGNWRYHTYGMRLATFCPCPGGDSPSAKRMFDAIMAGCIPVILSFDFVWPFTREFEPHLDLDPNDFSIRLNSNDFKDPLLNGTTCQRLDDAKPDLQSYLESIPVDEILRLRRGVERVRRLYSYYDIENKALPQNPVKENILPTGGAAHFLIKLLSERADGSKWKACRNERKNRLGNDNWRFQC